MKKINSLYANDFSLAMKTLKKLILERQPIFLLAQCAGIVAKASYLQHVFCNDKYFDVKTQMHSFFGNSRFEAVACGVKIARHKGREAYNKQKGHVCIYDRSGILEEFYNPFQTSREEALAPGLSYFKDLEGLKTTLQNEEVSGLIYVDNVKDDPTEIRNLCKENNIIFILDEFEIDFKSITKPDYKKLINPDAILISENIVEGQIPFGATIMTEDTYKPWNTQENFIVHSNTFGGNRLAMEVYIEILLNSEWGKNVQVQSDFDLIDSSKETKVEYLVKYYNPFLTKVLASLTLDRHVKYTYGSIIELGDGIEILDSLANFGVNLRGYSPSDIIEEVLDVHKSDVDYFDLLSAKIKELAGMPAVFPAISGASVVGLGVRLGLMSNQDKKKVIVFTGGYSGKTLVSIIGTVKGVYKKPFAPFYPHVIEIDPMAPNAVNVFKNTIASKDVALIWLELIQGEAGIRIFPEPLLNAIKEHKREAGYLIAADEVQSGVFRTGPFLNAEKRGLKPDIVTLAKAMSDMAYPMGAVLATDEVYENAKKNFPKQIEYYEQIYRNQLGAHICLHGIQKAYENSVTKHVIERGEQMLKGLQKVAKPYSFVKDVHGDGLFIGLEFNPSNIPEQYRLGIAGIYASNSLSDETPVLVFLATNNSLVTRFEPPLIITEEQVDAIIANASRSLARLDELFKQETKGTLWKIWSNFLKTMRRLGTHIGLMK